MNTNLNSLTPTNLQIKIFFCRNTHTRFMPNPVFKFSAISRRTDSFTNKRRRMSNVKAVRFALREILTKTPYILLRCYLDELNGFQWNRQRERLMKVLWQCQELYDLANGYKGIQRRVFSSEELLLMRRVMDLNAGGELTRIDTVLSLWKCCLCQIHYRYNILRSLFNIIVTF